MNEVETIVRETYLLGLQFALEIAEMHKKYNGNDLDGVIKSLEETIAKKEIESE